MSTLAEPRATYAWVVEAIQSHATRSIESRFAIGALVSEAIADGHAVKDLARDTGLAAITLSRYARVAGYWGTDRIPGCNVWWPYLAVIRWPASYRDETDIRARALAEGVDAVVQAQREFAGRQQVEAEERRRLRLTSQTSCDVATRQLWSAVGTLEEIEIGTLSRQELAKIAHAAAAIVRWAERLRSNDPR